MTRRAVSVEQGVFTVAFDDPPPSAERWRAVAVGQAEDEITGVPILPRVSGAANRLGVGVIGGLDGTLARAVGVQQAFYLAYQDADHTERLARYGRLCARLMGTWQEAAGFARAARVTRAETRIGIVSNHVHDHSVWNAIVKGWLQGLDRNRYDLRLYHLGRTHDVETALAKTLVAHYAFGKSDILEWVPLLLDHQLDLLIYPEIGMDPLTAKLASMRLAPVQAATWGHPITTGLPTIDYFLSSEALEPAGAEAHYSERLVRLPGLGCSYAPLTAAPAPADLAALGIREGVPVLLLKLVAILKPAAAR